MFDQIDKIRPEPGDLILLTVGLCAVRSSEFSSMLEQLHQRFPGVTFVAVPHGVGIQKLKNSDAVDMLHRLVESMKETTL